MVIRQFPVVRDYYIKSVKVLWVHFLTIGILIIYQEKTCRDKEMYKFLFSFPNSFILDNRKFAKRVFYCWAT